MSNYDDLERAVDALDQLAARNTTSGAVGELLETLQAEFDPDRTLYEVAGLVGWVATHLTAEGVEQFHALVHAVLLSERLMNADAPDGAGKLAPTPWATMQRTPRRLGSRSTKRRK